MTHTIRFAFRSLRSSLLSSATTVLVLALAIGANTAIIQALDAVAFRPLPVPKPEQLVRLSVMQDGRAGAMNYPVFRELEARQTSLTGVFASFDFDAAQVSVASGASLNGVSVRLVSGRYFEVLGVSPAMGRVLFVNDDQPGQHVAVISERLHRRLFSQTGTLTGQLLRVNGIPFTIIGAMAPSFFGEHIGTAPDVWLPLASAPQLSFGWATGQGAAVLSVMGRLPKEGATLASASASLDALFAAAIAGEPAPAGAPPARLVLTPGAYGRQDSAASLTHALWLLFALTGLVLVVGCCSIATILRAQGASRAQELRIRVALGATHWHVFRELILEAAILALTGGAIGLLIAQYGSQELIALLAPPGLVVRLDLHWHVLAAALALASITVVLFGVIPAYRAAATANTNVTQLRDSLVVSTRSSTALNNLFVVAQLAVSLPLVVGAVLLAKSVVNLTHQNMGFNPVSVVMVRLPFSPSSIALTMNRPRSVALTNALNDAPGVAAAAIVGAGPMDSMEKAGKFALPERPFSRTDAVRFVSVSDRYFESMGIPIVRGRALTREDRMGTQLVAVISESAALRFFRNSDPIGQVFSNSEAFNSSRGIQVVGVCRDIRFASPRDPYGAVVYQSILQAPAPLTSIVFRTAGDPRLFANTAGALVTTAAPQLKITEVVSLSDLLVQLTIKERVSAALGGACGILALLLASIGLFGVTSLRVRHATREIGVRLALGATPGRIAARFLSGVLATLVMGLALGVGVLTLASRVTTSLLFEVTPFDPWMLLLSIATLAAATLVSAGLAIRRVASLDPALSLRM